MLTGKLNGMNEPSAGPGYNENNVHVKSRNG
jgi:hypothetical protein